MNTRVVALSVDDREHALEVWSKVLNRQFTVLSDPGARTIRAYGLLHPGGGMHGDDIALDTTLLVDSNGRELWRHVSATLPDLPTPQEVVARIGQIRVK